MSLDMTYFNEMEAKIPHGKVRTRFAPSPTGYMHVGNLRTALYTWLIARNAGGTFILRIEDTDQGRLIEGATDVIYRTLAECGLDHDEGPDVGGPVAPYIQSERRDTYGKYAELLVKRGGAYYCFCEKTESAEDSGEFDRADDPCRDLPLEKAKARVAAGEPYVVRQRIPKEGATTFHDAIFGDITVENKTLDDQVLLKRDGLPTYNFANVIDDHLMHITHIMRGAEFITSTPKYILLYESFGWDVPTFIHLAPVMGKNEDGSISKLSKRHGATSFDDLVKAGYLPDAIVNYVALLGWNPKTTNQEIFSMDELIAHFSLEGLSKSPAVFDYDKLGWINGEYLKAMSDEDFAKMARPFAGDLPDYLEENWAHLAALLKTRIQRLGDLPQEIAFLCEQPAFDAELYVNKRNKVTPEKAADLLPGMMALLENVPESEWSNDALYEKLNAYIEEKEIKKGLAMWVLRIAAAGQKVTPGGATEILSLLGKKISLDRLKKSLAKLQEV